jgi:hypothetical protein
MPRPPGTGKCLEYEDYEITVQLNFPKGKVSCAYCEFSHAENAGSRMRCNLTAELLPYWKETIGQRCPLPIHQQIIESEENENDPL